MTTTTLLEQLIQSLRCLPGVGQKSAQRMAFHLLERDRNGGRLLAQALSDAMAQAYGAESLRYAMLAALGFYLLAALLMWLGARALRTDWVD